jgi:hypothetical protein
MHYRPYEPEWTTEDSAQAIAEGWDIFKCSGHSDWQLQRLDEASPFGNDDEAWEFVLKNRSLLHLRALEFLRHHDPYEFATIMRFKEDLDAEAQ